MWDMPTEAQQDAPEISSADKDSSTSAYATTAEYDEVMALLPDDAPHLLVEVGSHDGVSMSTSLPLVKQGWSAILIEPHPEIYRRLIYVHGDNADAYCVNGACGDNAGMMKLNIGRGDNTMLSSLVTDDNPWTRSVRSGQQVEVPVYLLRDILRERHWPKDYSLLLVDTEGYDSQVLAEAGLVEWRPRVIITEEYLFNLSWLKKKYELLWDSGYAPFKRTGDNMIWLDQVDWNEALERHARRAK